MLNGSTLKICFLMIVTTLCLIVLFLIVGIIFCKFDLTVSKEIVGMLGISALFGMICQAFIHANITDVANKQDIIAPTVPTTPLATTEVKP